MTRYLWAAFPYVLFFVGVLVNTVLQAKASNKSKANSATFWQWVYLQWHLLLARWFVCLLILIGWRESADMIRDLFGHVLPFTPFTAGVAGLTSDHLVDKLAAVLGIQVSIPDAAPPEM